MTVSLKKQPGLLTAVGIGVGSMIGSGWLFSAYYAAQYVGPAAYFSWIIGATLSLILAMLLAEVSGMFHEKALFSRLITISHDNADFGFVVAISGWLGLVLIIPTEASATVQYLSTAIPSLTDYLIVKQQHTLLGSLCIIVLVFIYSLLNFWGMRTFTKVSNTLAVFKIVIPILTALVLMVGAFHPSNFVSQGFAPYGAEHIFSGVVVCGIFYTFFGFSLVAMYGAELKDPQKNIPRALIISVFICFVIYLLLQTAFIGSVPPSMVAKGWSQLHFTSPLAQLLILLDMHLLSLWAMVLYLDSAVSPSGTAIICLSSAVENLTGMSRDNQFPKFFDKINPVYLVSRRALIFTAVICCLVLIFFKNWQELMILVSVFQLISCAAIPIAFTKLRYSKPYMKRIYRVKLGNVLSYIIYLVLSVFLTKVDVFSLAMAFALYVLFFFMYILSYYKVETMRVVNACRSSWSIFLYMAVAIFFAYFNQHGMLNNWMVFFSFIVIMSLNFHFMIHQKNYNC